MNKGNWIRLSFAIVCAAGLVSCSSNKHKNDMNEAAINDANAAYSENQAETSGTGEDISVNDTDAANDGNSTAATPQDKEQLLAKRIYYFDFDSNVVHDEDKAAVDANADFLVANPQMHIMLEGHTDPRGSREYNIGLGERRAKAVAEILTAKGVAPSQIRVVSYGAQKLAAFGSNEADYQQDRRVIMVYVK